MSRTDIEHCPPIEGAPRPSPWGQKVPLDRSPKGARAPSVLLGRTGEHQREGLLGQGSSLRHDYAVPSSSRAPLHSDVSLSDSARPSTRAGALEAPSPCCVPSPPTRPSGYRALAAVLINPSRSQNSRSPRRFTTKYSPKLFASTRSYRVPAGVLAAVTNFRDSLPSECLQMIE